MFKKKEKKTMSKEQNQKENVLEIQTQEEIAKTAEEPATDEPETAENETEEPEDVTEQNEKKEESEAEAGEQSEAESELADPVEQAYCLGAGIDNETLTRAKALLNKIADAVVCNKFDPEVLQTAIKILSYEETMDKIRKEAFATGRAEKVAEGLRTKKEKAEEAEAIPQLGGTKNAGAFRGGSIFEVARGA